MNDMERFLRYSKSDRSGCIVWTGSKTAAGYGRLWSIEQKHIYAHRFIWNNHHGDIPDGMHVCHTCDNPACVNIEHLFLGRDAENHHDKMLKGRAAKKLTPEIIKKIRLDKRGKRVVAKEYGVCHSTVGSIRRRRLWAWVK